MARSSRTPRFKAALWVVGVALVVGAGACGGAADRDSTPTPRPTPTAEPTPQPATPQPTSEPTPRPTEEDTAIVVYRLRGFTARPVDVTYTGEDGAPITVPGADPATWSKGGFWPVGAPITLTGTTGDAGNRDFSCEITMGGTKHSAAAAAKLDGNDIVGWECVVGPLVVESVL